MPLWTVAEKTEDEKRSDTKNAVTKLKTLFLKVISLSPINIKRCIIHLILKGIKIVPRSKKIKHYLAGQRYWEVFVIPMDETIVHACELMEKNRIGALVVVDKKIDQNNHHVVGIITERDIVKTISHHQLDIKSKPVEEIMSKKVVSASPEDSTDEAIKLMVENQIRHLAILDKDRLVGVISMRDIFYSMNFLG